MSRDVTGSAMLLDVIAGFDARDPHALPPAGQQFHRRLDDGVRGKRIAFSPAHGLCQECGRRSGGAGSGGGPDDLKCWARWWKQVDPPLFESGDPRQDFRILWWAGAGYLLGEAPEERKALLDPGLRAMVEEGAAIALRRYQQATMARAAYASAMRQFMAKFDFLLTPSGGGAGIRCGAAFALGQRWLCLAGAGRRSRVPFNLTQQPAASVPCGFTRAGLPVGLQIAGRMFDDGGVLAAATGL